LISHFVKKVALELYEGLATPKSLAAAMLLRHGEWDQLATLEADPGNYLTAEEYWRDASASSFLKKYEPLPTSFDRKAVAEEGFILCEKSCLRTNIRLYPLIEDLKDPQCQSGLHDFFRRARQNIAQILGPCPDIVDGRFGPGSTFGDKGVLSTVPDKMSNEPQLTTDAWPFLFPWSGTMWASACVDVGKVPKFVQGNRFTTVKKDCTKFRGIAIEPSINVFFQLGYGRVIRNRLRRRGINLDVGQDTHRALARFSSVDEYQSTIDLRNASDTISRNLVKLLLPARWFSVLDALRSKKTLFKGKFHLLEKFSSMGNGFTFELETLVFLGLISAITGIEAIGKDVFAFGDDIIVPKAYSDDVVSMLRFCGLETNPHKTFVEGPFRESCGGDFFNGIKVRPFYLKDDPDQPSSRIALANGLYSSYGGHLGRWLCLRDAWRTVLSGLPTNIRCLHGPSALGDIVIHDEDSSRWITSWKHGTRFIKCYQPTPLHHVKWGRFAPSVTLACATYGLAWNDGFVSTRNPELDYSIGAVPFS